MTAMSRKADRSSAHRLEWVPTGPMHRGGLAWESLRAAVRRRGFRVVGGDRPEPSGLDLDVLVLVNLQVDGMRDLYRFNEAIRGELPPETHRDFLRFAHVLVRIAGATPSALKRRSLHGAVLDTLEAVVLEETHELGSIHASLGVGPEGLWLELLHTDGSPLEEADGVPLELGFEGGPLIREELREGAALFRAGAALIETRGLVDVRLDFSPFGHLELEPIH